MRPLPGKARMYPETDIRPINITEPVLGEALRQAGEGLDAKKQKLAESLNPEMAKRMLMSKHLRLFEKLVDKGVEPMLAATTLEDTLVALRREGVEFNDPEPILTLLFEHYLKGEFVKSAIIEILPAMAEGKEVGEILKERQLHRISGEELKKLVIEHNKNLGEIMKNYRLRVDAREVKDLMQTI
jgi:glutamyl-tRNA(Gln) amidotransferase subunit E